MRPFPRLAMSGLLGVLLSAPGAEAAPSGAAPHPADCAAPSAGTVLHPWADGLPAHQRAAWIDGTTLRGIGSSTALLGESGG